MKTGKSYILAGLYNGQPYNALNDLTIDEQGRVLYGRDRNTARATLGEGLAVSAFPRYVPVWPFL